MGSIHVGISAFVYRHAWKFQIGGLHFTRTESEELIGARH